MTAALKHTDRPHHSVCPRPTRDPMGNKYGPLQPMQPEPRSFLARVFWRK
jgi:hypothetical protein